MKRFPILSGLIFVVAVSSWWESFLCVWDDVAREMASTAKPRSIDEFLDLKYQYANERSLARDHLDADLVAGAAGNADGAGTGGQD